MITSIKRLLSVSLLSISLINVCHASTEELPWQPWSDAVFAQAKKEDKLVLLDLGAVWCHWCHVMDETTYANPEVIALLKKKYVIVRVDQDSRPDLANRYEDYGWPATIVFKADGSELAKRRGYLEPQAMATMLQAFINDPSPGPSIVAETKPTFDTSASVPAERLAAWKKIWLAGYDPKVGGWGRGHKYLDCDNVGYAMDLPGDAQAEAMARETLKLEVKLQDPVWGGIDQYSAEGDWDHPHFEKIMQVQAGNMAVYARAFERWGDTEYLHVAREIHRYLRTFLTSPDGVVYTSQDADLVAGEHGGSYFALDDKGRRALGIPRVDQHIYARENGWVISALVEMCAATGEESFLNEALKAASWVTAHRGLPGGGFRHDEHDIAGPYLGDTLAMGGAFLKLYAATGDRTWLTHAEEAAGFITENFQRAGGEPGLTTAKASSLMAPPKPQYDENVAAARFANLLGQFTGKPQYHKLAELAFRYAASPEVSRDQGAFIGALLQAVREFDAPPLHVVIVGPKDDAAARLLVNAALALPKEYKQIEWYDRSEGPLPGSALDYPTLPKPAAFLCSNGACSPPVTTAAALRTKADRALHAAQ